MKKVLALVLAVMLVSTTAFAAVRGSTIAPSGSVKMDTDGFVGNPGVTEVTVMGTADDAPQLLYAADETGTVYNTYTGKSATEEAASAGSSSDDVQDSGDTDAAAGSAGNLTPTYVKTLGDAIFRSVTTENYTISSVKVVTGKAYVSGVTISDSDEQVKVNFVKDLDNVTPKDFDLSFTLKGKGKMIIRDDDEADKYNEFVKPSTPKEKRDTVTIPTVKFKMSGKVGYGKVTVYLGQYQDEDLDGVEGRETDTGVDISRANDVIKFSDGRTIGTAVRSSQVGVAGSYVADAILTEEYDDGLTLEARVYSGDTLYLNCEHDPDDIVDLLDTGDGDVDFYFFHENTKYTTLNTNAKLIFNETEEGDHVYSYKNGKLTEVGEYDDEEGCIVVRARTLGQYIVSDIELSWLDIATSDDVANPDTGANDVVGIAAALAAVALVSAAAVSLKK